MRLNYRAMQKLFALPLNCTANRAQSASKLVVAIRYNVDMRAHIICMADRPEPRVLDIVSIKLTFLFSFFDLSFFNGGQQCTRYAIVANKVSLSLSLSTCLCPFYAVQ